MSAQSEIVNDVPPPPEDVLSSSSRAATASHHQLSRFEEEHLALLTANCFNEAGKHGGLVLFVVGAMVGFRG